MISIVICCYNSAKRLAATIQHIADLKTDGLNVELIVVDNNSSDNTSEVAEQEWRKVSNSVIKFSVIAQKIPGLMEARKMGASFSKGEYIVFCDDDNWLDKDFLLIASNTLKSKSDIGAIGGAIVPVFEAKKPEWFDLISQSYAVGNQLEQTGYVPVSRAYLWGAGLIIRREAWESIFSNEIEVQLSDRKGKQLSAGGDTELCLLLQLHGWKLWYEEALKLKHFIPADRLTLEYALGIYRGFGRSSAILSGYFHKLRISEQEYKPTFRLNWISEIRRLLKKIIKQKKSLRLQGRTVTINHFYYESTIGRLLMVLSLRKKYDQSFIIIPKSSYYDTKEA